ncbi:hypothetical protein C8Q74DRAFT_57107 [Fomes fomentarius]|nr:hypothetical protein C8Q74DRAFT_57107 [Fomes fomentarius]
MDIIPQPAKVSRRVATVEGDCLARQMGLLNSRSDIAWYFKILGTVAALCDRYLPHNKDMTAVCHAKSVFMAELKEKIPAMGRYEKLWPVNTMVIQHRQLRRAGSSQGIRRTEKEILDCQRRFSRINASAREHRSIAARESAKLAMQGTVMDSGTGPTAQKSTRGLRGGQSSINALATEPISFLRSLPQDLSFLLPVFVRHGVVDEPSFRSIARMVKWRSWLYTWVKEGDLTELQFKMVSDRLEEVDAGA